MDQHEEMHDKDIPHAHEHIPHSRWDWLPIALVALGLVALVIYLWRVTQP